MKIPTLSLSLIFALSATSGLYAQNKQTMKQKGQQTMQEAGKMQQGLPEPPKPYR